MNRQSLGKCTGRKLLIYFILCDGKNNLMLIIIFLFNKCDFLWKVQFHIMQRLARVSHRSLGKWFAHKAIWFRTTVQLTKKLPTLILFLLRHVLFLLRCYSFFFCWYTSRYLENHIITKSYSQEPSVPMKANCSFATCWCQQKVWSNARCCNKRINHANCKSATR